MMDSPNLCIHSSVDGNLGFYTATLVRSSAVNFCVQFFEYLCSDWGYVSVVTLYDCVPLLGDMPTHFPQNLYRFTFPRAMDEHYRCSASHPH